MLIASLLLHQVKEGGAVTQKQINSECKTLTYISLVFDYIRPSNDCNFTLQKVKVMQGMHILQHSENYDISDIQYYVHIKLCKTAGGINLFKIAGTLNPENIKLNKNYIWDTLEMDWKEVSVTFNDNKINLPIVVTIKFQDKTKIRCLMKKEPLLFHLMLKQGIT